ncbi:MAG: hypothetical protein JSS40_11060 [Proteobacteria bacterium]|jgi:hypothetical protein|nr:hypothetical protein [Pseudomonadota bacterium]
MTTSPDLIAARIASLPMADADRREALAYVSAGEAFAQALLSIAHWFESSPVLKPTYHN